ncbi:preprotein translocase subunit SecA, partial [Bifidobacteriaceae bacterium NR015]
EKAVTALHDLIVDSVVKVYSIVEDGLGADPLRQIERRVVLSVLDRKWREHLYEMDYLKDGIGLRGMGQRDPLVEYQREGYQMYNSMIEAIKEESIQLLFHIDINQIASTEDISSDDELDEDVAQASSEVDAEDQAAGIVGPAPLSHAEGDVPLSMRPKNEEWKTPWSDGRTFPGTNKNDECPCGSGRKYKLCHGQNEAENEAE